MKILPCKKHPNKIQYKTERRAWKSSLHYFLKIGDKLGGVYKCPSCGLYHITSQQMPMPKYVEKMIDKYFSIK